MVSPVQSKGSSMADSFAMMLKSMSNDVQKPYAVASDMMSGNKPMNPSELILSIIESEQKLNLTVRMLNDLVRSVKQIEAIQA